MRRVVIAVVVAVVGTTGCANIMKPDPYAPTRGVIATAPAGIPDVRCAGTPSTGGAAGFRSVRQSITLRLARPDHRGTDLIATTDGEQILRGKLGYGAMDKPLANEPVELFACMTSAWQPIGTAHTRADGRFAYALHGSDRLPLGMRDLYASVVADRSGVRFLAYIAPPGSRVLVTDVDGTLTSTEKSFVGGALAGRRVGAHRDAAAALRAAAADGYQVVYLTARGDRFTDDTRYWLGTHGFPRGPVRLAPSLVVAPGSATVAYKSDVLAELRGFSLAGVGNRASDVAAYTAAGIPADRIFIKTSEYRGELATALRSGAAVGFGQYSRLPL